VDVRTCGGFLGLLDGPVHIDAVEFMVARNINYVPVWDALAEPLNAAVHTRNKVAGDDQDVRVRARVSGPQVPTAGQFDMNVSHDPETHVGQRWHLSRGNRVAAVERFPIEVGRGADGPRSG
jgi:hypothetical protein